MKKVTLTHTTTFDDDVSDEDAIFSAIEIVTQDNSWPSDANITITTV